MKKELYLYEGSTDYLGVEITEDRYIIVDDEGMDLYGEHFSLEEVNELIIEDYV